VGRIVALIVSDQARGQGVGGQLVTAAELFATSRDAYHGGHQRRPPPRRHTEFSDAAVTSTKQEGHPDSYAIQRHQPVMKNPAPADRSATGAGVTAPRIVVAGGHSAGHIEPMLNFADAAASAGAHGRDHRPSAPSALDTTAHPGPEWPTGWRPR